VSLEHPPVLGFNNAFSKLDAQTTPSSTKQLASTTLDLLPQVAISVKVSQLTATLPTSPTA
jgi:hypothetical protein